MKLCVKVLAARSHFAEPERSILFDWYPINALLATRYFDCDLIVAKTDG